MFKQSMLYMVLVTSTAIVTINGAEQKHRECLIDAIESHWECISQNPWQAKIGYSPCNMHYIKAMQICKKRYLRQKKQQ